MKDHIAIGSTPSNEGCFGVGHPLSRAETAIYAKAVRLLVYHTVNTRNPDQGPPTYADLLPQSAISILKEDPMKNERKRTKPAKNEGTVNTNVDPIDTNTAHVVQSGSTISQPTTKEDTMSDFDTDDGYTEVVNPLPKREPTKQEIAAEKAQAKIAAKAEKLAAKEAAAAEKLALAAAKKEAAEAAKAAKAAKAEKLAAKLATIQAANATTKEEREAAKAARAARLAELSDGRKYTGAMLALADRVKLGLYVKGSTGQLRSTNELAEVLDAVPVDNVIRLAKIVLGLDENPYVHLNPGQQSMNLRNKMRGAISKGTLTIDTIRECIEENGFATATDWNAIAEEKRAARLAATAAKKAAKEAKAAVAADAQE